MKLLPGPIRASLLMLAVAFGSARCHEKPIAQKQIQESHITAADATKGGGVDSADRDDWPPFYDSNNIAEYYGLCPKCRRLVKGYWGYSTYGSADGRLAGCISGISGTCEKCRGDLFTDKRNVADTRIVQWKQWQPGCRVGKLRVVWTGSDLTASPRIRIR